MSGPKPFFLKSVERRMRDHMSRQMTYVVHASPSKTPPHLADDSDIIERERVYRNLHRDAFHAGTPSSANEMWSTDADTPVYAHVYKVDRSVMDPVIRGDEHRVGAADWSSPWVPKPQLFEETALLFNDIEENMAQENPKVQPYRNDLEDAGSLSYTIPKTIVGKGVTYLGGAKQHEPK